MKENHVEEFHLQRGAEIIVDVNSTVSPTKSIEEPNMDDVDSNLKDGKDFGESSDDLDNDTPVTRKKRVQRFSDSESETENTIHNDTIGSDEVERVSLNMQPESEESDTNIFNSLPTKSRIRRVSNSTDSSADEPTSKIPLKNNEQQSRIKNKRNKMKHKFKSLVTARREGSEHQVEPQVETVYNNHAESSDMSEDEASSIEKIKQKIKERTVHLKSTIYDPDTSDEEKGPPPKGIQKQKKGRKAAKLTSPKPIRMSAKQAMENMQKIKSESNRMLREKEVSLPYHRPKALSLKDIMSRRTPAVSSDGKALPIKMNEEQLKHYAQLLEERQKDMMELCKSDTEEEETQEEAINEHNGDIPSNNDSVYDDLVKEQETPSIVDAHVDSSSNKDASLIEKTSDELVSKEDDNNKVDLIDKSIGDNESNTEDSHVNLIEKPAEANVSNKEDNLAEEITTNTTIDLDNSKENDLEKQSIDTVNNSATLTKADKNGTLESNVSADTELVYNDSVDDTETCVREEDTTNIPDVLEKMDNSEQSHPKVGTESHSQMISLHYTEEFGTEKLDNVENTGNVAEDVQIVNQEKNSDNDFSDDELNMDEIDNLIENAEILSQHRGQSSKLKPKLTGAPGMVIDLDGTGLFTAKKLTGVELLKQRFTYFTKLKTPEELEREKEQRIQPGSERLKLKQELVEQIAEQQSLEWTKRLEEEKQQQNEMDAIRGDASDAENDIDKIEAKLEESEAQNDNQKESSSESEEEEEEEEEMIEMKEKPRKRNPLIADEAEESDCDDIEGTEQTDNKVNADNNDSDGADDEDDGEESEESSDESEDEEDQAIPKKGRILKAFEDSDDEDISNKLDKQESTVADEHAKNTDNLQETPLIKDTQDDELQSAQRHKSFSDDLFTSQESGALISKEKPILNNMDNCSDDKDLGTQTFSILNTDFVEEDVAMDSSVPIPNSLAIICETQHLEDGNLDHVVAMCSGSFSQSLVTSQYPETQKSLDIGEDVLALCTGKFYDNQFVSQINEDISDTVTQKDVDSNVSQLNNKANETAISPNSEDDNRNISNVENDKITQGSTDVQLTKDCKADGKPVTEDNHLKSILDELNDPEFELQKPNKYFVGDNNKNNKENKLSIANTQKKRFVIDSDDEGNEAVNGVKGKKKKHKKKKMERRALQISDDEEDETSDLEDDGDDISEIESDTEKMVEYDSEENEIVVQPENRKKKRKAVDFFEQEAELTSEDEWAGSGDEDEAGLDRMEREAGDDDRFNQGQLQRELGQIHMRDVLDQDKRDVRLLQEMLFEDGDLGGGHRQRQFRWKNAGGAEDTDTTHNELAVTQEEELESEEQWRKQRHEREMYLKQLQKEDGTDETFNFNVNRSSIIKASLCANTAANLLLEANTSGAETFESAAVATEKKSTKDVPSPKKPFIMFQRNYHTSLLTRGRGALARLAALVTPLVGDDDAPKAGSLGPSSKRNFVFSALTPDQDKPKVNKRKADTNVGTPRLVKKMRTEDKQKHMKSSLLDHLV